MFRRDSDNEWEKLGRNDPYYGVLTENKFRRENLDENSFNDFLKSGQDYIDFLLQTIRDCVVQDFSPSRVLDFGCGVGRCSIALAAVCDSVVGIDVSEAMLQEARRLCVKQAVQHLQLMKSDDALSQVVGTFDLVHSFLVFQHIPRKRGERIFKRLIELLSDGGVGAIQFVYHRDDPFVIRTMGFLRRTVPVLHSIANIIYGKPFSEPLMEKNVYDINRLLDIIHKNGCGNVAVRYYAYEKLQSVIIIFQKKRDHVPSGVYGQI